MAKDETLILGGSLTNVGGSETAYAESEASIRPATADNGAAITATAIAEGSDIEAFATLSSLEKGSTLLGVYTVESDAIEGGMGKVFRVHHTEWNVDLAMKQPKAAMYQTKEQKENFIRECEAWINLGLHPHIVSCYYVREVDGIPMIFSEWMDEGSLKDWIKSGKLYNGTDAEVLVRLLDIAIQFGRGLHYAHEQGLIHQDVKPDNLLLNKQGEAKVSDFGIARARAAQTAAEGEPADGTMLSQSGGYTPAYCSMEQLNGQQLTRRTDVYSWAVSVLEMFLGNRPWEVGVVAGLGCEEYFAEVRAAIPQGMKELLRRCLHENEAERPHDFAVIEQELLAIYQDTVGQAYARKEPKAAADTTDSLNNRALSYLDLGKPQDAEKCWERALVLDFNHTESVYNYTLQLWRSGKIDDTEAVLRLEAVRENKQSWQSEYNLARVHLERGDGERATPLLQSAMKKSNGCPAVCDALARSADPTLHLSEIHLFDTSYNDDHTIDFISVCFSPSGDNVLLWGPDNSIRIWDIHSGESLRLLEGHTGHVNSVCMNSTGPNENALTGSSDGTLKLWDIATGECQRTIEDHIEVPDSSVRHVCMSEDGKFALCARYFEFKLWDISTGECLHTFLGHNEFVNSVCMSTDGCYALSGSDDSNLKLWCIKTGECLRTFIGHTDAVFSVCMSADGMYALSASADNTLRFWDIATGECLRTYTGHKNIVESVCISPNGRIALSRSRYETAMMLWDIESGKCLCTLNTQFHSSVCFSPDGRSILAASTRCVLHSVPSFSYKASWELCHIIPSQEILEYECSARLAEESIELALRNKDITKAICSLQEMEGLAGFSITPSYIRLKAKIGLFCRVSKLCSWEFQSTYQGRAGYYDKQELAFDGQILYEASADSFNHKLDVWDIASGKLICACKGHTNRIKTICFSADKKRVLTGGAEIKLWDIPSGKCLRTFCENYGCVEKVSMDSGERRALSINYYGQGNERAKLWDIETGKCLHTFPGDDFYSACFCPNGKEVISRNKDSIKLWDISTGDCIQTFFTSKKELICVNPDGTFLLSYSSSGEKQHIDDAIELWDIATGTCLRTLKGHTGGVQKVCISPNGLFALSAGKSDKTLKLWDISNEECIRTFNSNNDYESFRSLSFSQDGQYVMAGSEAHTIRLWKFDYEYEFPGWADWDEGARPFLGIFLAQHPNYNDAEFDNFISDLQNRGYGWLRPEGVKAKLEEMRPLINLRQKSSERKEPLVNQTNTRKDSSEPNTDSKAAKQKDYSADKVFTSFMIHYNNANSNLDNKEYETAIDEYNEAINIYENVVLKQNIDNKYGDTFKKESIEQKYCECYYNKAMIYKEWGEYDAALTLLEKAHHNANQSKKPNRFLLEEIRFFTDLLSNIMTVNINGHNVFAYKDKIDNRDIFITDDNEKPVGLEQREGKYHKVLDSSEITNLFDHRFISELMKVL